MMTPKKRSKLTASSLGRTYGDDDSVLNVDPDEETEAIDGATFIKRFLRFKF